MKIEDELLKPYYIQIEEDQFTVKLPGKIYGQQLTAVNKSYGYFTSLDRAVGKIIQIKQSLRKEEVVTLKEYVEELKKAKEFLHAHLSI